MIIVFRLQKLNFYSPNFSQAARKGDISLKDNEDLEINFKDIAKV